MLEKFHDAYRLVHVAVGASGLLLFWIPIFTRKGGVAHRAAGRWFVRAVYFVTGTGLFSSAWALTAPSSFFGSELPSLEVLQQVRFLFSIFGFLAVLALQGAILGTRVLRVKDDGDRLLNRPLSTVMIVQLLYGLGLAGYGATALWQSGFASRYYVTVALAVVGLWDWLEQRNYIARPQPSGAWLGKHIECMFGCGIAFYTAAVVTTFAVVLDVGLPGAWALVPWLIPAAIGIPATQIAMHYYRDGVPLDPRIGVSAEHQEST